LYGSVCAMMTPIGLAAAAPLAESFGVRAWYVTGGVACVAMGLLGFLIPSWLPVTDSAGSTRTPPDRAKSTGRVAHRSGKLDQGEASAR
jgi:DHA3 family macrolide efflux protein-like MFS transporter